MTHRGTLLSSPPCGAPGSSPGAPELPRPCGDGCPTTRSFSPEPQCGEAALGPEPAIGDAAASPRRRRGVPDIEPEPSTFDCEAAANRLPGPGAYHPPSPGLARVQGNSSEIGPSGRRGRRRPSGRPDCRGVVRMFVTAPVPGRRGGEPQRGRHPSGCDLTFGSTRNVVARCGVSLGPDKEPPMRPTILPGPGSCWTSRLVGMPWLLLLAARGHAGSCSS